MLCTCLALYRYKVLKRYRQWVLGVEGSEPRYAVRRPQSPRGVKGSLLYNDESHDIPLSAMKIFKGEVMPIVPLFGARSPRMVYALIMFVITQR